MPADKLTELSRIKLKSLNSTVRPYDQRSFSPHVYIRMHPHTLVQACMHQHICETYTNVCTFLHACMHASIHTCVFVWFNCSLADQDSNPVLSGTHSLAKWILAHIYMCKHWFWLWFDTGKWFRIEKKIICLPPVRPGFEPGYPKNPFSNTTNAR